MLPAPVAQPAAAAGGGTETTEVGVSPVGSGLGTVAAPADATPAVGGTAAPSPQATAATAATGVAAAPTALPPDALPDASPSRPDPEADPVGPAPDAVVPAQGERDEELPRTDDLAAPGTAPVQPQSAPATAGSPAPAVPPAAHPLTRVAVEQAPAQVQPAVAELARGLRDIGGGRASLVVRLDPPELGPVVVRLTVRDGRVDVQLRTGEAVASVGLAAASADVRSTLAQHGLDLSSFDVAQGDTSGGAPSERRASSDQATPERRPTADRSTGAPRARGTDALPHSTSDQDAGTTGAWL